MKSKVCLPICVSSFKEVVSLINKESAHFDYFEIWLDYLVDFEIEKLLHLIDQYPGRLLLLFRRKNLEPTVVPQMQRRTVIENCSEKEVFIDFDITVQLDDLDSYMEIKSNSSKMKLIVSYHNYDQTPAESELHVLLSKMIQYEPEIVKFSCFCKEKNDALLLLSFLSDIKKESLVSKAIVLGMGEFGLPTRILGSYFGNEFTFVASDSSEKTAEGQLKLSELREFEKMFYLKKKE